MPLLDERDRDLDRLPPPDDDGPGESPGRGGKRNVVAEIAERRRADIREEMPRLTIAAHLALAAATPPPRPILDRLAAPGLHLIAEIKRSSPSAGENEAPDKEHGARRARYHAGCR